VLDEVKNTRVLKLSLVSFLLQNMPTNDWGDREIEILLSSAFVLSTLFGGSEAHLNVVRTSI